MWSSLSLDITWSFSHRELVSVDPHCDLQCISQTANGRFLEEQKYFPRGQVLGVGRRFSLPLRSRRWDP